ncbi:MAG: PGPGW domain-containing protein [Acidobacteria bacterium]|nr:PGPGW domain-containing protein [Acidobacteriota bacterium]
MGFLVLGLLGWLLPIIPGWAFIIPGLMLLSREFHWAKRTLQWLKRRFPQKTARD